MDSLIKELEKVHWLNVKDIFKRTLSVLVIVGMVTFTFVFYDVIVAKIMDLVLVLMAL